MPLLRVSDVVCSFGNIPTLYPHLGSPVNPMGRVALFVADGISSDVEKSVSKMHSTLMMMDCKTMGLEQAFAEFLSNLPATGDRERRKRKRDTEAPSGEPLSEPLTSSEEITEPVSPRQGKDRKVRRRSLAHSAGGV